MSSDKIQANLPSDPSDCSAAREMELVTVANNLAFTLKQIADYHVPQAHPDYELAMSEIADAKRIVTKGKA